jgi:response regulator RpfG family c-di-GMP phosphodiesterase
MFANGLLIQLGSLLHIDKDTLFVRCNGWTVVQDGPQLEVLAATGALQQSLNQTDTDQSEAVLPDEVVGYLNRARTEKCNILENGKFVGYFPTKSGKVNLLYLDGVDHTDEIDVKLVRIFSTNVTIAFDNLYLDKELYETQGEIIETLGDVVETRSKETANHVKRVAHLSRLIGRLYGLSSADCETLFMASPMHDIGKVAIPDRVLLKPGKLDAKEWVVMKTHAQIGAEIFSRSTRPVLVAASIVAGQHHERFDGSGYPNGLAGENIHIFGRIVALVDVFDALIHRRCYKESWPLEDVINLLEEQKGLHFDPKLVDLLIGNLPLVEEIVAQYPDADT